MRHFILLCLLGTILASQACKKESSQVDPDRIKADYTLIYDQRSNQTTAEVRFSTSMFNGRSVQLNQGASVQFNNMNLDYVSGGTYRRRFTGLIDSGTFVFRDNLDRVYTNTFRGIYPIDLPSWLMTITRGQSMDVVWSGDVVAQGEFVDVRIKSNVGDSDSLVFTAANPGANSIFIDGNRLFEIQPSNEPNSGAIIIERYSAGLPQQTTPEGGSFRVGYRVERLNFTVF